MKAARNVEQRGTQPNTVFVHGFGGDLHSWDSIWPLLGDDLPTMRYDLRGFGQSPAPADEPFSHVEDLTALLDARGIDRVDLVGISMGGAISVGFALDHPKRVRSLVLISPGLMGWEWSEEWRQAWRAITIAARGGDMDRARQLWFEHPLFETTRASPAASALSESIARYSGAQWIRDPQRPVLPDVDRLHQLTQPILLLAGDRDMPDFRLAADLIAGSAPNVRRVDYPALGHMLTLEAPAQIAEAIRTFLRSQHGR